MKLRNKKTGEVQDSEKLFSCYESLKELSEYWEDYTPDEPLIKDEKIRKVVRVWAELNCSREFQQYNNYQLEDDNNYMIEFADSCFTNLKIGKSYTIAELCGEEEE